VVERHTDRAAAAAWPVPSAGRTRSPPRAPRRPGSRSDDAARRAHAPRGSQERRGRVTPAARRRDVLGALRQPKVAVMLTLGFSVMGLRAGLATLGILALVVAFASSTQDIVVDAWRIEAASDADELGLLSAAYQLGYRLAIIVTDALILIMANHWGWRLSYAT